MERDRRGFTLVELLAVIVIIGIMAVFAFPYVSRVVSGNKDKVYVQDAKKLLALAEYKMESNDIKIEKPDPGDCIVLSYTYLNDGTLKDAPNKGEYLPGASYVVVKNTGGKMEYLVSLIETNDENSVFRGVLLASENELNTSKVNDMVKSYKKDELLYVTDDASVKYVGESSRVINKVLINGIRNNFIDDSGDVEKIYVYDDLEQGISTDAYSPSIITVNADSKFDMEHSKFIVDLSVVALDKDNDDENELKLCIRPSNTLDKVYATSTDSQCVSYTSGSTYKVSYDYSASGDICGSSKTMFYFISVYDPNKKTAKKYITKEMSKNSPPTINNVSVTKKDGENNNIHIVKVKVDADDDFSKPKVCINEKPKDDDCSYMDYKSTYEYTLKDGRGNNLDKPDGNLHNIYVHFKDGCGLVTTSPAKSYQVSTLVNPEVSFSFVPEKIRGIDSLKGALDINITDSFVNGDYSKINISVESEGKTIFHKKYSEYLSGNKTVTLPGTYDGNTRELKMTVQSVYDRSVVSTYQQPVYTNQAPDVNLSVESKSISGCVDCVGSYDISYSLDVTDDLDSNSALEYCVGESSSECNDDSKYNSLVSDGQYTFSGKPSSKPYNGAAKKLYVTVKDSQGAKKQVHQDYNIYNNQPAVITSGSFEINPLSSEGRENIISITDQDINIDDDFNDYKVNLCYTVDSDSKEICANGEYVSYEQLIDISNEDGFVLKDSQGKELNGQTAHLYLSIKDSYDAITKSDAIDYYVESNNPPSITIFKVESNEEYNSNSVTVKFNVNDDADDTYQICINNSNNCSDYSDTQYSPNNEYVVDYEVPWDSGYGYVYLFVKDKYGLSDSKKVRYDLYDECSQLDTIEENETEGDDISSIVCGGRCYVTEATDGEDENDIVDISAKYSKKISYIDKYFRTDCSASHPVEYTEEIHKCDYYECFGKVDDVVENAIGTTLRGNEVWTFNFISSELDESGIDFSFDTIADGGVSSEVDGDEQPVLTEPIVRSIQCNGHYNMYNIRVNSDHTLTASLVEGEEICPELADSGYSFYQYNSGDAHPYIRFNDSGFSG